MKKEDFNIVVATEGHMSYVPIVLSTIEEAAKIRGTGIAKRSQDYIEKKIQERKAIIAVYNKEFAGFCYIETWGHEKYAANSGLIVVEKFRGMGLAKSIKRVAFEQSRERFPNAKLFGLTTGLAVMKINSELGYKPVPFSELSDDDEFWKGCQSCVNYDILTRTKRNHCLCTGMLYDPAWEKKGGVAKKKEVGRSRKLGLKVYARWMSIKRNVLLKNGKKKLNIF